MIISGLERPSLADYHQFLAATNQALLAWKLISFSNINKQYGKQLIFVDASFQLNPGEKVGLVGHMPHLGEYAAWLLGNKKAQIDFAKSGVAMISCGEMPGKSLGSLQWLVTPEWY